MAKWSKHADKYTVKIAYDKRGRAKVTVPSPLIIGFDKPDSLTFVLGREAITVRLEHLAAKTSTN